MKLGKYYPVYLNPTIQELTELAENQWDSLRVLTGDDIFLIGSGYGNTHNTLMFHYGEHLQLPRRERMGYTGHVWRGKCPYLDPYIFFHDNSGIMLANLGDVGGPEKAMPRKWKKSMSAKDVETMVFIAELSNLRHD